MAVLARMFILLLLVIPAPARTQVVDERALRAAMVYRLLMFAEWPQAGDEATHFHLCVVSEDAQTRRAFQGYLDRPLKGRRLAVHARAPLADLGDCEAVMFDGIDAALAGDKIAQLEARPVLTLAADLPRSSGAMIVLSLDNEKLAFEIDLAALRRAGLRLPARVIELARKVHR